MTTLAQVSQGYSTASAQCDAPFALPEKCIAPDAPTNEAERIEVGRQLLAIKATMRGGFKAWIEAECSFSYRSAAMWMAAARDADRPVPDRVVAPLAEPLPSLAPTRFADESTMTEEQTEQLTVIARDGIDAAGWLAESEDAVLPRLAGSIAACVEVFPHARFSDLVTAANRARLDMLVNLAEIDALIAIAKAQPPNGLVSSCQRGD